MSLGSDAVEAAVTLGSRHWRLWEWLNGRLTYVLSRRPPVRPDSLRSLWLAIRKNEIKDGDFIEFKTSHANGTYWYLQEWVPRAPGSAWLNDNLFELQSDVLETVLLDLHGIPKLLHTNKISEEQFDFLYQFYGPFSHWEQRYKAGHSNEHFNDRLGVYRPALGSNEDKYALLGLVTQKEFFADLGFPILVSKEVYKKFSEAQDSGNAVEIEALVQVQEVQRSGEFDAYIQAIGSDINAKLASAINNPIGFRNLVGYVQSPLDLSVGISTSHPKATIRIEGYNGKRLSQRHGIIMINRCRIANPADDRDLRMGLDFLLGEDHQFGTIMVPVTDFDGRIRRFRSIAPIATNPKDEPAVIESLRSDIGA